MHLLGNAFVKQNPDMKAAVLSNMEDSGNVKAVFNIYHILECSQNNLKSSSSDTPIRIVEIIPPAKTYSHHVRMPFVHFWIFWYIYRDEKTNNTGKKR